MDALYSFAGNGTGGSVALKIYPTFVEYEHNNYFAIVPFSQIANVTYSKRTDAVYASVSIGDVDFGCDNKAEVYAAMMQAMSGAKAPSN